MRRFLGWLTVGLWVGTAIAGPPVDLDGFVRASRRDALEQQIRTWQDLVSADRIRRFHHWLTEEPHVAGTPRGQAVAEYIARRFRAFGLQVAIDSYHVLLSYPKRLKLTLVEPETLELDLRERGDPRDKDAFDHTVWLPFNGYSASGDVTAQVVYVNYGTVEDYRTLEKMGVSVRGRIVIARYGRIFRGIKALLAEERGAVGLILYSDPRDDGYHRGDVYPHGPWRPDWAVQRGSVMHLTKYPGDPLTPGFAAPPARQPPAFQSDPMPLRTEPQRGRRLSQPENLPQIPVIPIAYGNAVEILKRLGGPVAPQAWQGGLPITYHVGPGAAKVRMVVEMDTRMADVYNVIGWLPGETDELIILGNHHDAWTYGAVDPSSGTAVLLEVARVLGAVARAGYRPRRTVMLAAWDAEEYGLIGSTEFVERYRSDLQRRTVAYINCDSAVTGSRPRASASPHVRVWIEMAAARVSDPLEPGTWLDRWVRLQEREVGERPEVGFLGSGSDYTAFLDFAGISAVDVRAVGAYGVYHANIDDFYWMTRFTDPFFLWHRTVARWLLTVLAIGLEADRYPFYFTDYAVAIQKALQKLASRVEETRHGALRRAYERARQAAETWLQAAQAFDRRGQQAIAQDNEDAVTVWNRVARTVEQRFLHPAGLPGRSWFRHQIFAPGRYLGYGAQVLPAVEEALDEGDPNAAAQALERLTSILEAQTQAMRLEAP